MSKSIALAAPEKKPAALPMNRLLVAMELGPADEAVLHYLRWLVSKTNIEALHFLHVLPPFDFNFLQGNTDFREWSDAFEMDREVLHNMRLQIERDVLKSSKKNIAHYMVKSGDPLEEMLLSVEQEGVNGLIIGQRSDTAYHVVLARNLARKTQVNTLIIPSSAAPGLDHILVPIDFSPNSARALTAAVQFAKAVNPAARITCLNVYEMPPVSAYRFSRNFQQFQEMVTERRRESTLAFINTYGEGWQDHIQMAFVEKDMPGTSRYIAQYAEANQADLIVLGAKGHSKVELLLMGSVTESLLSINDDIPTLIVK